RIQRLPVGIQSQTKDAKALERIAALLPHLGHLPPGRKAHFDRADQLGRVVRVNFFRCLRVETLQNSMQISLPPPLLTLPQPLTQFLRSLGAGEKSIEQRSQIKSCTPDHNGQSPARFDVRKNMSRAPGIFTGRDEIRRLDDVEKMMGRTRP